MSESVKVSDIRKSGVDFVKKNFGDIFKETEKEKARLLVRAAFDKLDEGMAFHDSVGQHIVSKQLRAGKNHIANYYGRKFIGKPKIK